MRPGFLWIACWSATLLLVSSGTVPEITEYATEARASRAESTSSVPVSIFQIIRRYFNPQRASQQLEENNVAPVPVVSESNTPAEATNQRPIAQFASNAATTVSNAFRTAFQYISPVLMVAFPFLIPLLIGGGAAAARNFDFERLTRGSNWNGLPELARRVQDAIQELRDAWEDEDYY